MARRIRKTLFGRSFQRTLGALTRATLRSGTRAVLKASKKALKAALKPSAPPLKRSASTKPRRLPVPSPAAAWLTGVALSPAGARRYRLFTPPGTTAPLPLLVMLHGCDQDADGFARSTRLQSLAAREGFMLMFPEQERLANPHGCWNWFDTRSGRAFTEAASLVAAVDQVCAVHGADPARVAIAGLSAGASMAAFVALHHPDRFKAVAMHSGIAPGAAHSTATALGAMGGRRVPTPLAPNARLPPLLVIHGSADLLVRSSNALAAARLWADAAGAAPGAARTVQRGSRRAMTLVDFKQRGRLVATWCEVAGLGHAWSGGAARLAYGDATGPDASRMVWAFAAKQFAPVASGAR